MKVILAIGHSAVEATIEKQLPDDCEVVGIATYREAILTKLRENPTTDVVLIRDTLQGEIKILTLIHQIRAEFNKCRIILMTKHREAGDPFLSAVVSYAVWDIILGYKVSVSHLVDYILHPRTFKDVERFQKRVLIDETTSSMEVETSSTSFSTSTASSSYPTAQSDYPSESVIPTPEVSETVTPQTVSYPQEEQGVRKGSMREQLLKQMGDSQPSTFGAESSVEPFVFEPSSTPPLSPVSPIPSQSDIPLSPNPSFTLDSDSGIQEVPIPKFGFETAKAEPVESEEESATTKKPKLFSTKDIESIGKPLVGHRPAL